ncbi:hypothetical protein SAMN05421866_2261 [Chryseobacterium oranimense]|uniref:Uncharacterized protein n=1 Tax=Chryseobacterium oranimense TaxID=421058 RepID=A0A1M5R5E8_9FLAO|nr:hypothetical protein SAMN05421866_2261 [Chryseobacterium oranimense]
MSSLQPKQLLILYISKMHFLHTFYKLFFISMIYSGPFSVFRTFVLLYVASSQISFLIFLNDVNKPCIIRKILFTGFWQKFPDCKDL